MKAALYDEAEGYYCRRDRQRWGRRGDYRTSPERSPLFAATFARYFATLYQQSGAPDQWTIAEAGAGNGAFAEGILQTLRDFYPYVFAVTRYVVDEVGPTGLASERLQRYTDRVAFRQIEDIVAEPGIVFSNELLDAFPVHRVVMRSEGLRELYVGVRSDGSFELIEAPLSTPRIADHLNEFGIKLKDSQFAEVNLGIEQWMNRVAAMLRNGFLVTVDYGAETEELYDFTRRPNGTLRSFKNHELVDDFLISPGRQDLTSTINWSVVKKIGDELDFRLVEFATQNDFLLRAGLLDQLELVTQRCATGADRLTLRTSAREMILPNGMAADFQVLVQQKRCAGVHN